MTSQELLELAVQSHRQGQFMFAESQYRKILKYEPNNPDALFLSALLARQTGRMEMALDQMTQAVKVAPGNSDYWNGLGVTLAEMNRLNEAIGAYQQALALKPDAVDALSNLGDAFCRNGDWDATITVCRRVVALRAESPEAHCNLGVALFQKGMYDQAVACYKAALSLRPNYLQALNNLGNALARNRDWPGAIERYRAALAIKPDMPEIMSNLADALSRVGEFDEAVDLYRGALALRPELVGTIHNLGNALLKRGDVDEAVACHKKAAALRPDDASIAGDLILATIYHPDYDSTAILDQLRKWDEKYARPLLPATPAISTPIAGRRLKIGYLSADFRDHVVGRNVLPLLREHDKEQFETFCYSNVAFPDSVTELYRTYAAHFKTILPLNDEQAAELIRQDQLDILVELALCSRGNRLLIMARKPAPIQVTFAGYPGSTGMKAIDWRLTDPYLDPPGSDADYVARSHRLPHSFWCYDPAAFVSKDDPPLAPPPALANGLVTFGCLNNSTKINDAVLALWSRVLQRLPKSRFIVNLPKGTARRRAMEQLAVDPGRVDFVDYQPRPQYLAAFARFDIGLDTIPYNGHTSSLDAMWMGVPVITRVGRTVVGRAGWSQLSNLKLTDLAAHSNDEFVEIAVALANDQSRLVELRNTLRQKLLDSPLTNAKDFTRGIEQAYREMIQTSTQ
jgi:predicted O-linked N-acetylglucosamine transferase (SPINDLY family)